MILKTHDPEFSLQNSNPTKPPQVAGSIVPFFVPWRIVTWWVSNACKSYFGAGVLRRTKDQRITEPRWVTFSKFNIYSPWKVPTPNRKGIFQPSFFRGYCMLNFRGCKCFFQFKNLGLQPQLGEFFVSFTSMSMSTVDEYPRVCFLFCSEILGRYAQKSDAKQVLNMGPSQWYTRLTFILIKSIEHRRSSESLCDILSHRACGCPQKQFRAW